MCYPNEMLIFMNKYSNSVNPVEVSMDGRMTIVDSSWCEGFVPRPGLSVTLIYQCWPYCEIIDKIFVKPICGEWIIDTVYAE